MVREEWGGSQNENNTQRQNCRKKPIPHGFLQIAVNPYHSFSCVSRHELKECYACPGIRTTNFLGCLLAQSRIAARFPTVPFQAANESLRQRKWTAEA